MKSKISLSVLVICLIFVLVGCSGVVTPTTASFQETISSLDTPEKLSDWMLKNIEYESHYEIWVELELCTEPPQKRFSRANAGAVLSLPYLLVQFSNITVMKQRYFAFP